MASAHQRNRSRFWLVRGFAVGIEVSRCRHSCYAYCPIAGLAWVSTSTLTLMTMMSNKALERTVRCLARGRHGRSENCSARCAWLAPLRPAQRER